jgi:Aldehyde dehydrogenase family
MTTTAAPELTTFRWSSDDEADRFSVEDPATGEVIAIVQGGGAPEVNAAVEAAHRASQTDWRTAAERAHLLLQGQTCSRHMPTSWRYSSRARSGPRRQRWPGVMSERTLLEAALARLDEAALAVMRSAATNEEQHQILGYLVSAHSLLHALSRLDPAEVDELI